MEHVVLENTLQCGWWTIQSTRFLLWAPQTEFHSPPLYVMCWHKSDRPSTPGQLNLAWLHTFRGREKKYLIWHWRIPLITAIYQHGVVSCLWAENAQCIINVLRGVLGKCGCISWWRQQQVTKPSLDSSLEHTYTKQKEKKIIYLTVRRKWTVITHTNTHQVTTLTTGSNINYNVLYSRYRNECDYQEQLRGTLEQLNKVLYGWNCLDNHTNVNKQQHFIMIIHQNCPSFKPDTRGSE